MRHKPRWLPLGTPPPRRYPHGVPRGSGRSGGRSDHGHEGDRVSPRPRSRRRRRHRAHSRRRRPGAQPRPAADAGVLGLGSTTDQPRRGLNRQRPCSHTEFPSRTSHNGVRPVCAWTVVRYRRGGLSGTQAVRRVPAPRTVTVVAGEVAAGEVGGHHTRWRRRGLRWVLGVGPVRARGWGLTQA